MDIQVNGTRVSATASEGKTLEELLGELREQDNIAGDDAIVGLKVNGEEWNDEDFEDGLDTAVSDVNSLDIETVEAEEYVSRVLDDTAQVLALLVEAAGRIAETYRTRTLSEASQQLFWLLDSVQSVVRCMRTARIASGHSEPSGSENDAISALADSLEHIESCQGEGEWERLANLLEEDLVPAMQELQGVVQSIEQKPSE